MEKRLFKTTTILVLAFLFYTCSTNRNEIDEISYYINNISQIKDTIKKMNLYNIKLLTISLKETDNYNHLVLEIPKTPHKVLYNYEYKLIEGVNVLLYDTNDTIIRNQEKLSLAKLIKNHIISFDGREVMETPPYYKFIFCKDNMLNVKCFGVKPDSINLKTLKKGEYYYEKDFYPNCNSTN